MGGGLHFAPPGWGLGRWRWCARELTVYTLPWLVLSCECMGGSGVREGVSCRYFTGGIVFGYVGSGGGGGGLATTGMFVPAFVYVAVTANVLPRLRKSPTASAFLDGVNAAAVALMGFVGFQFAREVVVTPLAAAIAAVSAVLAFRFKVNSAWLIVGGAVCGLVAKVSGWG